MRWTLVGLLAALAISAGMSASASALQWYVNGVLLAGALSVESTGIGNTVLKGKVAGIVVEIVCARQVSTGTFENAGSPVLGLALAHWHLFTCTAPKPAGCVILNQLLFYHVHYDLSLNPPGNPELLKLPLPGSSVLGLIPIRECTEEGNYTLEGEAVGLIHNSTSSVSFEDKGVNNKLKLGGKEAELESDELVLMEGGGGIEVK
ncbi:MAG: hypothetical protein ACLPUT_00020 [Solirubrobacteraceae bacterium]